MKRLLVVFITAAVLGGASRAAAQPRPLLIGRETPRAGSWEIGGGITGTSGISGPSRAAELTRNGESSGGFDLFTASGKLRSGAGLSARVGVYLSPRIVVEGGLRFSQPVLTYRLSGDFEEATDLSSEEMLSRYVFTGSVVLHLRQTTGGRRVVPFLAGGAGYIRDLHQGNELVETGTEFHALGGLKYWFGSGGRRFGIRGDAGVSFIDGGFDFRETSRVLPIASASIVYLF